MDRYKDEEEQIIPSRSDKNQELYQNLGNNTRYTNFAEITSDINSANAFEINTAKKNFNTREGYQQIKEYQNVVPQPKEKKELDEFNYFYKNKENRIYDINSVLEEARKNRIEKDQLDEKRKLKNNDYNIFANINKEELERYRKERVERPKTAEEEDLRGLLDTITSKTLAGEIDKATTVDLLSDLMATNIFDKIEKPEPDVKEEVKEPPKDSEEKVEEKEQEKSPEKDISLDKEALEQKLKETPSEEETSKKGLKGADSDFYTRSMDLSDKDLNWNDEINGKKMPFIIKLFLSLILIAVIAVAAYYIYQII